ncbi:MAG: ribosome biogenesis GTPase Der [Candidatus Eisenbacteria bacterium]|uniref:GTPase Der n=1 Tax=Eiseniibacteriota bacterium TaxID=2212470 RepID=A0A948RXE3_UNCEI|nr:ribosome biogenesis GTPase Der [Candidatus Eisenbacteria bacterium]MBU1947629.1 ribosome biogenesis GTPase Der [Candidatus Eisenbacteria bacterium]MBU2691303.1 ribosome biogenesis GTPase Der [Candidatus Eisenbacteria bacterium]
MSRPVVAIVGRPNVGKSTLFNRILKRRLAIVSPVPGVTRDRHIGESIWEGLTIAWIDTGGWLPENEEEIQSAVTHQLFEALHDCDLVLFMTDAREGLHPIDVMFAGEIRRQNLSAPVLVVVNKADSESLENVAVEFTALGWDRILPISAQEGRGIGDMLDAVVKMLPEGGSALTPDADVRVAVLGQPNVGKSSLINKILGEERMIVSGVPGTTRDAVDLVWKWHGRNILLVDTAGIKRRTHSLPALEFYGTMRALKALERSEVVLFLIDATQPIARQDQRIAGLIRDSGRAAIILVNKWDMVEKDTHTAIEFEKNLRDALPFLDFVPVYFISALTGQRVGRLAPKIFELLDTWRKVFPPRRLMELLEELTVSSGEPRVKIKFARQATTGPPSFALYVKDKSEIRTSTLRYLEDRIRDGLGLKEVPVRIWLRSSKKENQ